MGAYNSAVITTAGQSLLARAIADNLPFYFTSAKTTEYVVPTGTSAASLTELPNIKQSEEITSATVSSVNQVVTSVRFDNTDITLNYSINTIGVYARVGTDTEETLLAVITAITADVMPSYSAANPVSYVYSINLAISNASNINIVVSPTGTVNVAEFTELKERVDEIIDSGSGLSTDAKMALLNCFEHVAWIDEHGQTYYDTLHDALFPSAVSISATFTPGSHVFYETDSLDALRPYLIVRATMPDSTVEIVTDYILTGSMAVGTNTITVRYQGLTDTFEVTTQANPAYIEAVFTQPQSTIYTDDTLDSLKDYLVVTYYSAPGATGTVLADSAYTLSGTLAEGTSVITASYQGLTDTFNVTNVVDFYNIYTRSTEFGTAIKANGGVDTDQTDTNLYPSRLRTNPPGSANYTTRRTLVTNRGHACIYLKDAQTAMPTDEYPIPIPLAANHVKVTLLPAGQYVFIHTVPYDPATNTYLNSVSANKQSWTQMDTTTGVFEKNIVRTDEKQLFIVMNFKHDSSGTDYTSATEPTLIKVEFSEV